MCNGSPTPKEGRIQLNEQPPEREEQESPSASPTYSTPETHPVWLISLWLLGYLLLQPALAIIYTLAGPANSDNYWITYTVVSSASAGPMYALYWWLAMLRPHSMKSLLVPLLIGLGPRVAYALWTIFNTYFQLGLGTAVFPILWLSLTYELGLLACVVSFLTVFSRATGVQVVRGQMIPSQMELTLRMLMIATLVVAATLALQQITLGSEDYGSQDSWKIFYVLNAFSITFSWAAMSFGYALRRPSVLVLLIFVNAMLDMCLTWVNTLTWEQPDSANLDFAMPPLWTGLISGTVSSLSVLLAIFVADRCGYHLVRHRPVKLTAKVETPFD